MTLDDVRALGRYQEIFEKDPGSVKNAYKVFRELNRHGRYMTVVRLYDKHELQYASPRDPDTEKIKS